MGDSIRVCQVVLTDLVNCPSELEHYGLNLESLKVASPDLYDLETTSTRCITVSAGHRYGCVCCFERVNTFEKLEEHMRNTPRKGHQTCRICGTKYKKYSSVQNFVRLLCTHATHHTLDSNGKHLPTFTCDRPLCRKVLPSLFGLRMHRHADEKRVKAYDNRPAADSDKLFCEICKKQYKNKRSLSSHLKNHIRKRSSCEICHMSFSRREGLKKHMQIHSGEVYKCSECAETFSRRDYFRQHWNVRHSGETHYPCNKCDSSFTTYNKLRHHRTVHLPKQAFPCTDCSKTFHRKDQLKIHKNRMHALSRPFACKHCGKCFSSKYDLRIHEYNHSGVRPYSCTECNKSFKRLHTLQMHQLIHNKLFKCYICDQSFALPIQLAVHLRVHTTDQPFVCIKCKMAFRAQTHLSSHSKTCRTDILAGFVRNHPVPKRVESTTRKKTRSKKKKVK